MPGASPKPRLKGNKRTITDFFKQFSVPKHRVPVQHEIEDEIIVAIPRSSLSEDDRSTPHSPRRAPSSPPEIAIVHNTTLYNTSPKGNPVGKPALDRTFDQDSLPRPVLTPIRQRVMVEDKVPSLNRDNTFPLPPAPPISEPPAAANMSFSSISSLSSVPLSSQSSSRRIVKSGMFAVTNSDSGSEDSESDGLTDIEEMIERKKRKLTPSEIVANTTCNTVKPSRQSARVVGKTTSFKNEGNKRNSPLSFTPEPTVYKHSLLKIVKQNEQREINQAKIAEAEALMAQSERRKQQNLALETAMDVQTIAAAVADDSDEGGRMLQAMNRTEALQQDEKFYYFTNSLPCAPNTSFPASSLPNEIWTSIMTDKESRQHACLTGFSSMLAKRGSLPLPVFEWFACQLVHEPREELCNAYTDILINGRDAVVSGPSNISSIRTFYDVITSKTDSSRQYVPISGGRSKRDSNQQNHVPMGLENVIRVAAYYASKGVIQTVIQTITDLILANIDENVKVDANLQHVIQSAISSLLDTVEIPDVDAIFRGCVENLRCLGLSRVIECIMIYSLPATTPRTHDLRRCLALHHILVIPDAKPLSSEGWQDMLLTGLKTAPTFRVNDSTDYNYLLSLTPLLDIGLDVGFDPFVETILPNTDTSGTSGQYIKPTKMSPEERAFNAEVDILTAQIQVMISRIKNAGATHLRRMETKTALEGLRGRLQFCVRTRPKLQKGIFSSDTGEQANFMAAWTKGNSNGGIGAILDQKTRFEDVTH